MVVEFFVVVGSDVPAGKILLDPLEESRVSGHQVFKVAVNGAVLDHPDLAVALDDARLDLAHLLVDEHLIVLVAYHDLLARFLHAGRAKRIGLPGPTQWRFRFLPGFQERLIRPFGGKGRIRIVLIEKLHRVLRYAGSDADGLVDIFHESAAFDSW